MAPTFRHIRDMGLFPAHLAADLVPPYLHPTHTLHHPTATRPIPRTTLPPPCPNTLPPPCPYPAPYTLLSIVVVPFPQHPTLNHCGVLTHSAILFQPAARGGGGRDGGEDRGGDRGGDGGGDLGRDGGGGAGGGGGGVGGAAVVVDVDGDDDDDVVEEEIDFAERCALSLATLNPDLSHTHTHTHSLSLTHREVRPLSSLPYLSLSQVARRCAREAFPHRVVYLSVTHSLYTHTLSLSLPRNTHSLAHLAFSRRCGAVFRRCVAEVPLYPVRYPCRPHRTAETRSKRTLVWSLEPVPPQWTTQCGPSAASERCIHARVLEGENSFKSADIRALHL
jgi:hypothetical protein